MTISNTEQLQTILFIIAQENNILKTIEISIARGVNITKMKTIPENGMVDSMNRIKNLVIEYATQAGNSIQKIENNGGIKI